MSKSGKSPLLIPAVFWIFGIIVGKYLHFQPVLLLSLIFIGSIFFFLKKAKIISILSLILLLGILRISINNIFPENHIRKILEKNPQIIQPIAGKIISQVNHKEGSYRFILELSKILNSEVKGKINFCTNQEGLKYGDLISTIAEIRKIRKNSNPTTFDYEEYLSAKGIYGIGFSKTKVDIIGNKSSPFGSLVISVREWVSSRIEGRFHAHSGFIKAIVIGDKRELGEKREILTRAGLSHILAVSGLHVGILSLIFFSIFKIIFRQRNLSRSLLIPFLVFYGALCNWTPSVTRAVIMISFYLISKIIQRKPDTNNILSASLIVITALNPFQLFSIGFQLSFTAVFVLLNIVPNIRFIKLVKEEIEVMSFSKKLLNGILIILFSSAILNIFLLPIIMYHFHQFNLNGILGNLLGIPLISVILTFALLIIILPNWNFLILIYQSSFKGIMLIFDKWSDLSSSCPLFYNFFSINIFQLLLIYLFLGTLVIWFWKFNRKKHLTFSLLSFILILIFVLTINSGNDELKVTFFDCGLGDLFLVETRLEETILIDSGPPDYTSKYFGRSALPYLQENGISSLDWVIITHAHNDHYGGLDNAFINLKIRNLAVTDEFQTRIIWKHFKDKVQDENCEVITISDTTHLPIQGLKLKIIHPDKAYHNENINNMSIVTRLDYKDFSVLFTGDLEQEGEKYLLEKYPEFLDTDILKICHHGSKTSSTPAFIKAVSPEYAFIPTSLKNRFNFPHETTLEKYSFLGEDLFIAGKDGALQIITDGKKAYFKTFLSNKEFSDYDLN
ncbi:MAG TPA: DNA internalization-related competence protein ComEC/Rec2 [Candidatus Cloacimonetes bacterium]|nr:DNA internalization-related competence protein ComEC/Rec2 [Candidatus Cloacimonadota bacterium]